MTYNQLLREGRRCLEEAGIADAVADAWLLLSHVTGWNRTQFYMSGECEVSQNEQTRYEQLLVQRAQHIPTQHLTGMQEFMGIPIHVTGDVLIPRQETELLVEWVLESLPEAAEVLDLCTGSGCIAIALQKHRQELKVFAAELSPQAFNIARHNIEETQADVTLIASDLFTNVKGLFDCIVSNPPYITGKDLLTLEPEVREHEPQMALYGGEDGLDFYRRIIAEASGYLKPNGKLFFEIGYDQGQTVPQLLREAGYTEVECRKDYAGLDRMVCGRYTGKAED